MSFVENGNRQLIFSLSNEEYAVPLHKVKEVIEIPEITPVPHTPNYCLGIMNLRGQVISIIDLRWKIKGIQQELSKKTAVIIIDFEVFSIGIAVSAVNRVITLAETEIKKRPAMETKENLDYITGVTYRDKKFILLLDLAKALQIDELNFTQYLKTA